MSSTEHLFCLEKYGVSANHNGVMWKLEEKHIEQQNFNLPNLSEKTIYTLRYQLKLQILQPCFMKHPVQKRSLK